MRRGSRSSSLALSSVIGLLASMGWLACSDAEVPATGGTGGAAPDAGCAGEGDAAPQCPPPSPHERAGIALAAYLTQFWDGEAQYIRSQTPHTVVFVPASYWIYAQAFDAVLDGVDRTEARHYRGLVDAMAAGQAERGYFSQNNIYDDENWMVLALVRAFDRTGNQEYLTTAEQIFADVMSAWDETCCGDTPGGIWWDRDHTQKATASNGGPVIAAARLASRTKDATYLDFALQTYGYWSTHMVDPDTHQVLDHIASDGAIVPLKFSYNEGVMIGGALELYAATGQQSYLDDARAYAGFMLKNETAETDLGPVLHDGDAMKCGGDCPQFKAIGFRYLAELQKVDPTPEVEKLLKTSADAVWKYARDPATGRFGTDWTAPPPADDYTKSGQMVSAVVALNLGAMLDGPFPDDGAKGRFEAEDGVFRHVGVANDDTGFTGWGYIAGWKAEGQGLDVSVDAPSAGKYVATFRFAAGDGNASRRVSLNGKVVQAKLSFPSTGEWQTYAEVEATLDLPKGPSTIALDYDASSSGELRLDHVRLSTNGN